MSSRISGLASGMDIDVLVKDMMKPMQTRIDKVLQRKTKDEWVQEAYDDVNATLARFVIDRTTDMGLLRSTATGMVRSTGNLTWVKKASSSDTSVATASANSAAVSGSYDIRVERLAANWSAASTSALPAPSTGSDSLTALGSIASQFSLNPNKAVVDFTITTNKGSIRVTSDQAAIGDANTQLYRLDPSSHSLLDLAYILNSSDLGIKASYDPGIRRFFLQTGNSGSSSTITITDASHGLGEASGFLAAQGDGTSLLKLADASSNTHSGSVYAGVDALLDVGAAKGIVQPSNEFSVNGVSLSLHKPGEIAVRVSTDVETAFEKIKKLIGDYNQLMDRLQNELNEKYDRGYLPLTDDQRSAMSDDQIEKWEERAKTGLLSRSSEISQLVSSMRQDLFTPVQGVSEEFNVLTKIGIGTEAYSTDGKLVIDDARLKAALEKDADSVVRLLFQSPDSSVADKQLQKKQTGLVNRLFGDIIDGMKSIVTRSGTGENAPLYRSVQTTILLDFVTDQDSISMIDRNLNSYSRMLLNLDDRFNSMQARYYSQFTAMEQAIQRANMQSAWLSQQFSSMGSK